MRSVSVLSPLLGEQVFAIYQFVNCSIKQPAPNQGLEDGSGQTADQYSLINLPGCGFAQLVYRLLLR